MCFQQCGGEWLLRPGTSNARCQAESIRDSSADPLWIEARPWLTAAERVPRARASEPRERISRQASRKTMVDPLVRLHRSRTKPRPRSRPRSPARLAFVDRRQILAATCDTLDVGLVLEQMEADKRSTWSSSTLVGIIRSRAPLARLLARVPPRSARVWPRSKARSARMIAYATQPDNVALDGDGRNSPFTTALLKHIVTPGLEISSVMKRRPSRRGAATRNRQVPWDHSSLIGDVVLGADG